MGSVEEARKFFASWCSGCVNILLISANGESNRYHSDLCYSRVFKSDYPIKEGTRVVFGVGSSLMKRAGVYKWLDYLFNRSPFKDAFITKSYEDAVVFGVEIDTSLPVEYLKASSICFRRGFELDGRPKKFSQMVEWGFSEEEAFAVALNIHSWGPRFCPITYDHEHDPIKGGYEFGVYTGQFYTPYATKLTIFDKGNKKHSSWEAWVGKGKLVLSGKKSWESLGIGYEWQMFDQEKATKILNKLKGN